MKSKKLYISMSIFIVLMVGGGTMASVFWKDIHQEYTIRQLIPQAHAADENKRREAIGELIKHLKAGMLQEKVEAWIGAGDKLPDFLASDENVTINDSRNRSRYYYYKTKDISKNMVEIIYEKTFDHKWKLSEMQKFYLVDDMAIPDIILPELRSINWSGIEGKEEG